MRLSCVWVTRDGVWIDDQIYCTLWYSAWLQFTIHYYTYTHTSVHSHDFTSRCSVAASKVGRSPSSGFPNYPCHQLQDSHSNSPQRLNLSSSLTHWLTQLKSTQLTLTNWPAYDISARTAQKTLFLYCCVIVDVETYLFEKSLLSNGCCIAASLTVIA
jgi:hypothetical protein